MVIKMAGKNNDKRGANHGANELNERKRKVLWAVVQDYSETAEPVGSRTIARKYNLGVSSATIRNEMQDLEDEGYLEQPHTSAGRIPSIKGYRFYVDWLMQPSPVTDDEKSMINHILEEHVTKQDEISRDIARTVASLTHTLSVATSAGGKRKFNYMRFLPLDGRRAIMLVVTNQGEVSNAVVDIPADSSLDEMQLLADRMNHFLHGREIDNTDEQLILSSQKDVERDLTPYMHEGYAGKHAPFLVGSAYRCSYRHGESGQVPFGPFHCPRAVFLGRPHYRLSRRPGAYEDAVQQDHRNDAVHAAETGYFIEEE